MQYIYVSDTTSITKYHPLKTNKAKAKLNRDAVVIFTYQNYIYIADCTSKIAHKLLND